MDSSGTQQRKGFNARDFVKTNIKPVTISLAVIGVLACLSTVLSVHLSSSESNKESTNFTAYKQTVARPTDLARPAFSTAVQCNSPQVGDKDRRGGGR